MTSPTDDGSDTAGTYVRRFFALLAIRGATVSGQVTAVSPLTETGSTYVRSVRELGVSNGPLSPFLLLEQRDWGDNGCDCQSDPSVHTRFDRIATMIAATPAGTEMTRLNPMSWVSTCPIPGRGRT